MAGPGWGWWRGGRTYFCDKAEGTALCLAHVPSSSMAGGSSHHVVNTASQIQEESWKEHKPLDSRAGSMTCQLCGLEPKWDFVVRLGEGNGTPLQYSCLENPVDGGAW